MTTEALRSHSSVQSRRTRNVARMRTRPPSCVGAGRGAWSELGRRAAAGRGGAPCSWYNTESWRVGRQFIRGICAGLRPAAPGASVCLSVSEEAPTGLPAGPPPGYRHRPPPAAAAAELARARIPETAPACKVDRSRRCCRTAMARQSCCLSQQALNPSRSAIRIPGAAAGARLGRVREVSVQFRAQRQRLEGDMWGPACQRRFTNLTRTQQQLWLTGHTLTPAASHSKRLNVVLTGPYT